jgi:methionine-rich copper-binding protein CopC
MKKILFLITGIFSMVLANSYAQTFTHTSLTPADNATNVDIGAITELIITFDRPIYKGKIRGGENKKINIRQNPGDDININVNSNNVTTDGNKAIIKVGTKLSTGSSISVQIPAGTFVDDENNNNANEYEGIAENDVETWNFTTAADDSDPPTISSLIPATGQDDIDPTTNLIINFSESVTRGQGAIIITAGATEQSISVTSEEAVSIDENKVTINPADLPYNTQVSIQISPGAFQDAAGNEFIGITDNTIWNFTTAPQPDNTPPTVISFSPAKGETNIILDRNLILTFDELIEKGLIGSITLYQNNTFLQSIDITNSALAISDKVLTINPPQDLPEGATVSVQITQGTITDLAGNVYAGISDNTTWQFTTLPPADEQAPVVDALSPANNAAEVAVDENLLITFDEPVQAVEAKKIFIYQNNTLLEEILATSDQSTITGNQVSINPSDDFAEGATIYLLIEQGAFQDLAENAFAGISSVNGWQFKTVEPQDQTAPRINTYSPDDGDTDVAIDADLVLTFNEVVEKGTGTITITAGNQMQTINVTDAAVIVNGTTVTINPADLPYASPVVVQISAGTFQDAAGNAYVGITDNTSWNFTTAAQPDVQAPLVSTYSPANNTTDVALDQNLILTFDEPIQKAATGSIIIYQGITLVQIINITDASVSVADNILTIDPPQNLPEGATLSVQITAGAITDLAGNVYGGITDNTSWQFTTLPPADKQAPTVTSLSPANNATEVLIDANLIITFDEAIQATDKKITIYQNNVVLEEFLASSNQVTISDKQATINPINNIAEGASVYVFIEPGAFQDLSDNDFAGISTDTGWRFSTVEPEDLKAPIVEVYSPVLNETEVDIASTLTLTFSEPVQKGIAGNVTIYQDTKIIETIELAALSISEAVLTIDPLQELPGGVTLHVQITPGVVTDLGGNPYAGITNTTWTFTTKAPEDQKAPLVLSLSPANNTTNIAVDANLVLTFDEAIQPVENKTISIYQNNNLFENISTNQVTISDKQVTVNPTNDFLPGATIYVLIEQGAFVDAANNAYAGITDNSLWKFTTTPPVDDIAPTVTLYSPADEGTDVSIDANLVLTFDESIQAIDGKKISLYQDGVLLEDILTSQVSLATDQVTINPINTFTPGATVYVLIEQGAFTDLAGNAYMGITFTTDWNFTIAQPEDTTPPSVITFSPEDEETNVGIDANLVLIFDEAVEKGSGTITITAGTEVQTINVTDAAVTIDGTTVTINPTDLPYSSPVVVQIAATAFQDAAGNAYVGIADNSTWNFTTAAQVDTQAPSVTILSPADEATEVDPTSNLVVTFSEAIQKAATGNVTIYQDNTLLQTIELASLVIADNILTMDPPQDLPAGVSLNVRIQAGTLTDLAGNAYVGITDNTTWNFTTAAQPDVQAPLVSTYSPANNATDVALDQNLILTFDEPIQKAATGSIIIYQGITILQSINITDAAVSVADNILTIDPPQNLPEGATLSVQITAGAITDLAGNAYGGITDNTSWQFTTLPPADKQAPTVASLSPANNATEVLIDANLIITFDEAIQATGKKITIYQNNVVLEEFLASSNQVTISDKQATINPINNIAEGASVYVLIEQGAFTDLSDNAYLGITDNTTWNFTITSPQDTEAPTVATFNPATNAMNIAVTSNLAVSFNEPIQKGIAGNVTIYQGTTILQTIAIIEPAISVTDNVLTIDPLQDLPEGATVHVLITAGAIVDLAGNAYAGITDNITWQFTTAEPEDKEAPLVLTYAPAQNAVDVDPAENLTLTFNEPILIGEGNITILQGFSSQQIDVNSPQVSISSNTVSINPNQDFPSAALVSVRIEKGAFQDNAGNLYEGIATDDVWTFKVKDVTPLLATSYAPNKVIDVPVDTNLEIEFNKDVIVGTGTITIYAGTSIQPIDVTNTQQVGINGNKVTINPENDLPASTLIYIHITEGAFKDASANSFAGIADNTSWAFTTAQPLDETDPFVSSLVPTDEATDIAVNTNLVLTFSEPVIKGEGTIVLQYNNQNQTVAIASNLVTVSANIVTIDPPTDLPYATLISVLVPQAGFRDIAENAFAGITDPTAWTFTTSQEPDLVPPTITSLNPAKNAQNVPTGSKLELIFDEPIARGEGNIAISQNNNTQLIDVNSEAVMVEGSKAIITPDQPLLSKATVRISIEEGTFTDLSGNPFEGLDESTAWTFNVEDETGPLVTTLSPSDDANDIPVDANLEITFDEEVEKGQGQITINTNGKEKKVAVNSAAVTIANNIATIDPNQVFPTGATISVLVDAGTFINKLGKPFQGITDPAAWNFRTLGVADEEAPTVTMYSPIPNSTNVEKNTNLVLTFSEPIIAAEGNITLTQGTTVQKIPISDAQVSITENILTIDPSTDFVEDVPVSVSLDAGIVTDLAENAFTGITDNTTWTFTIRETIAPTVATLSPTDEAVEVTVDANLVISFNEPIQAIADKKISIYQDGVLLEDILTSQVSLVTDQVTINPVNTFTPGATVYVLIEQGAFTDLAGNPYSGITTTTEWNFTVAPAQDITPPTIITFSPEDEVTEVGIDANLVITFDEVVEKGTGTITITAGTQVQTINVTDATVSVDGTTVTINPADLPFNSPVVVQISAGAFVDMASNAYAGISDNTSWNFTTAAQADTQAPLVTTFSPADEATEVPIDANLVITFDEALQASDKLITIYQNNVLLESIAANSNLITLSSSQVTIDPVNAFTPGATVYVLIEQGAFTDLAGNAYMGITTNTGWNFTIAQPEDTTPPSVITFDPPDEAVAIPIDANLVLTFDEAIEKATGTITITAGTQVQTINVTDVDVIVDGMTVTINPADLPYASQVIVQISADAFVDAAGNAYVGITDNTTWNFTTAAQVDTQAPSVSTYSPADEATEVDPTSNLVVTFSEAIQKAAAGNVTIYQDNTLLQTIELASLVIADNILTIDPPQDLPAGVSLNVRIQAGTLTDLAGNAYVGISDNTSWNFTTATTTPEDTTPPSVATLSPTDEATEVAIDANLVLTFDEVVEKGTGTITITAGTNVQTINVADAAVSVDGMTVTINPADLPYNSPVVVQVSADAFQDAAGNDYVGITDNTTWNFTTTAQPDTEIPIVVSFSPANNATNVGVNENLLIVFNEPIKKGFGNIRLSINGTIQDIAVSDETVLVNGATVTINPASDFPGGAVVSVTVEPGTFTDLTANPYAGNTNDWIFSVVNNADNEPPTASAYSPADDATDVAIDAVLTITFSEEIKKGTGNIIINQGNSTQSIDVTSELVTINGNIATITPPENFPSGSNVSILMLSGAFTDMAGNSFAGINNASTWNFTVPDNIEPELVAVFPLDNTTDVAPNVNLVMIFNENIVKGSGSINVRQNSTVIQEIPIDGPEVIVNGTTAIINPPNDFPVGTTIAIQVPQGGFTDSAGNPFIGITNDESWTMTTSGTADNTGPIISALTPADESTDVATNSILTITFDENITKGTGNIIINQGATSQTIDVASEAVSVEGNTIKITPPANMPEGSAVHVLIPKGAFVDLANNNFAGISTAETWNFQITDPIPSDVTPPAVVTYSPADNATNVQANVNLVLTFNEPVAKGKGNISINLGTNSRQINIESDAVTIDGAVVTIDPSTDLPAGSEVSVLIEEGALQDIAGNVYVGIDNPETWNFTVASSTIDIIPSAILFLLPQDDATNVPANANLVITFNEPVKKGNGLITINQGTSVQEININSAAVTILANILTINPPDDLPAGAAIFVQIPAGAITDLANNAFPGITSTTEWNFTIAPAEDTTPPTVTSFTPTDEATEVGIDANLVITFDEVVEKGTGTITITAGTDVQTINVADAAVIVNGTTVTINPGDLPYNSQVVVQISADAFVDASGNAYVGIADNSTWNFTTAAQVDTQAPSVTILSPADEATEVDPTSNLVVTFSEAIQKGAAGNVTIYQDNTLLQTIELASLVIADNILTIDPPQDLPAGVSLNVRIQAGTLTDLAGNAYVGITDNTSWNFTTATTTPEDTTPPSVATLSPTDEATEVAIDANLVLTFDEVVEKGTGTITITAGTNVQTINVADAAVSVDGPTVTINPNDLPYSSPVVVQISADAFQDVADNAYVGITDNTTWNFTTTAQPDVQAPLVTTYSPANNATEVALDQNLILTFDEPIQKGTAGTISIYQGNTLVQAIAITNASVTITDNVLTINPPQNLPENATLSVQLTAGAITDLTGNAYVGIIDNTTWSFTTTTEQPTDETAPIIISLSPADNDTEVALDTDLEITFDETIQAVADKKISIYQNDILLEEIVANSDQVTIAENQVSINLTKTFAEGANVYISIENGSFTDLANNAYVGITDNTTWNFTTAAQADTQAPLVTTYSPANNAIEVATNSNLVLTFDEPIQKAASGNITIYQGTTLVQTIAITDATVSLAENILTIDPPQDLPAGATISIQLQAGLVSDLSGNAYTGISDNTSWNFTTAAQADTQAPLVTTFSPADEATEVAIDTDLALTFNEAVEKGTGTITITAGSEVQTINVTDVAVIVDGMTVTINPADLPYNSQVIVQISADAFVDASGNAYVGIADNSTWNFTTAAQVDTQAPSVTILSPADEATEVDPTSNLVVTFSEAIQKGAAGNVTIYQDNTLLQTIELASLVIADNILTIDPPQDLPAGATISIQLQAGLVSDLSGNAYAGISDNTTWNFTTATQADTQAPLVTTFSPADEATEVAIDTDLTLIFDEVVEKGTGTITITAGTQVQTINVADATVVVDGTTVTINPNDLPNNSQVVVQISTGAFQDMAGNAYVGITDNTSWNFTTTAQEDITPPIVANLSPADEAIEVDPTSNLVVTFSEPIQKAATGSITIYQGTTVVQTLPITDAAITIAENVLTINPPQNLPENATLSVQISADATIDLAGNAYAGITDNTTWNFTTAAGSEDTTPPTVITLSPADEAAEVAVNANVVISFDEAILATNKKIRIYQNDALQEEIIANGSQVTIADKQVTINPTSDFAAGATIYVLIEQGAFTDLSNNAYAGIADNTLWNFTIVDPQDTQAPTVLTYSPANASTNVAINSNLVLTFDEAIKKATLGTITLYQGTTLLQTIDIASAAVTISEDVLTINPSQDLPAGVAIHVQISLGALTDLADNAYAGISDNTTWQFTTAAQPDNTAPILVTLSPTDGATNVPQDAGLTITFDEAIQATDKKISVYQNNTLLEEFAANSNKVSLSDKQVTINLAATFAEGATIYVVIEEGAFTDQAGNIFAGITDNTTWQFTILEQTSTDVTAPKATLYTPADKAENVAANTNLEITFDEPVKAGSGTIVLRTGNTTQPIPVTSNAVSFNGNKVTINPPANFAQGATVNVEIPEGVITDLAGNAFEGTDATTWSFTIITNTGPEDTVAPEVVSFAPANTATGVAPTTNLIITFNEAVKKGTTGNITIYQGATLLQTIAITEAIVTIADEVVTINPPQNLPSGESINIRITQGAITDLADNAYEGITNNSSWQFTTSPASDNTTPLVSSIWPADGAVNVPTGENLVITFNENIVRKAGNIQLTVNNVPQTIDITDQAKVSIAANVLTINPSADFPAGAQVSVEIPNGVVTDEAGNPFRGIESGDWRFTVATEVDKTPPTVTLLSPADNAAGVPVNANLTLTFSEPVKKGTGIVTVSQYGFDREIPIDDQSISVNGNNVSIDLESDFLPGTNVYVLLPAGILTDMAGNTYAGITDPAGWNFTVANSPDISKPIVNSLSPSDNSTDIAANTKLVLIFNKQLVKGQGNIIITHGTSSQTIDVSSSAVTITGDTVTIDPPTDFPSESYVSVLIVPGVFKDIAGNAFEGILDADTWNFTIIDTKAPTLLSLFPDDNASNIPANINLVLAFDENISKGSGQIIITAGDSSQTIDITSDAVIVSGSTVIINPPVDFPYGAQVSIQIPEGAFLDASGNPFAGLSEGSTWNLTISAFSDTSAPVAISFSPADNSTAVPANANMEIIFSENVTKGTGSITINHGNTNQTIDISSADVLIDGTKVTINPPADFPSGEQVHVLIPAGVIKDQANNSYVGIAEATGWNFTIDASVPVSIVSQNFPEIIQSSAANVEASIELNRVDEGMKVELVSRGIASADWNRQQLNSATVRFPATLAQTQFDEIGLEYYFDITLPSGIKLASDTGYTYIQYVGTGLDIPDLQSGATVDAYQIISIPLDLANNQISAVLEDDLNEYNIKKWRFFNYRNGLLSEYQNGLSTIETGNGYWLISRNPANINTGEGTTVKVRSSNPYVIRLKKGWNQIGNPYNFNISWNDVKAYNKLPEGLGNLRVFESEYKDSDLLRRFRGAFVFAEEDMAIQIPVLKNQAANGRISAEQEDKFNLNSLWEVNFSLVSKEMNYRLGGAGMNADANFSKDRYDDITVPRFVKYLEMNFRHEEYFAPKFTKDIRPVETNQTWDFTVESNIASQAVTLGWKKFLSEKMDQTKKLVLYDITHDKAVDLLKNENYVFHQDSLTQFKLFYGTPEYIQENLQAYQTILIGNFPNPFRESTTISFRLSAAAKMYQVRLLVYDLQGKLLTTLKEGSLEAGTHEVQWDGTDASGRKLPAGMYLYKLESVSENGSQVFIHKLLIQ